MTDQDRVREDVIALLQSLPDTTVDTIAPGALAADGATPVPEIAWGDTFAFHTPGERAAVMPFATIVTKDYPGDEASDLGREGAFRVNANVGREAFTAMIGYPPAEHPARAGEWDYAADGALIPHPLFAAQGWVSVVNPATADAVAAVVRAAHDREVGRGRGRETGPGPDRAENS